jgi:hypothetical protein
MQASAIVEQLDVLKDVSFGFIARFVVPVMNHLVF